MEIFDIGKLERAIFVANRPQIQRARNAHSAHREGARPAQSAHLVRDEGVAGSNPATPTST